MAVTRILTLVVVAATVVHGADYDHTSCRSTKKGTEYVGGVSETESGKTCQRWDTDFAPHDITIYSDNKFPDGSRSAAQNYCRNPDSSSGGPWCYTTDPDLRWEYCNIKHCFGWVSSVEPRDVGQGGAVRITLRGEGFADNQFNFADDSNLGNKVWFVNEYNSVECEIFPDGSNEEMIQCYTPEGMYDAQWKVRLSVDGVETPTETGICNGNPDSWTCSIRAAEWKSPYIDSVVPRSGPADGIITIWGRFFSDLYGSDAAESSNGQTAKILRVYVDGQPCALKDGDDFYGLAITKSWANYGYITCKASLGAAFSGNVSVIIEAPYGRTYVKPSGYNLDAMGKVNMYQTYAAIDSISAQSGSINGGQLLTITGRFFDETDAPAEVKVGEDECVVESLTSEQIVCRTPAEPAESRTSYPGNRGMRHDYFNQSITDFNGLESLRDRTDEALSFWTHSAYWCESYWEDCQLPIGADSFNIRSRGYFVPRLSGDYQFYVRVDEYAKVFLGNDSSNVTLLVSLPSSTALSYYWYDGQASERMTLTAGTPYYIEALAREGYSWSYLQIAAKYFQPNLVEKIDGKVEPEVQRVDISSVEDKEIIKVTLDQMSTRSAVSEVQVVTMTDAGGSGTWQLGMNDVYTDLLDVDTSDRDLEKAINDLPSIYPETVIVSASDITNGRTYTITFNSDLGNWPQFTKKESGGASVTIAENTDGQASLSKWRLHLDHGGSNLLSDMISSAEPTQDQFDEAVNSLFSARCPRSIGTAAYGKYFYEGNEDAESPGFYGGTIDYESEPFCGRASGMNVARLYDSYEIDISGGGHICFAYRGVFRELIRIQTRTSIRFTNLYLEHTFLQSDDGTEWFYQCIDLLAYIELYYPGEAPYKLGEFEVYRWPHNDIWVDEVVVAGRPTTENNDTLIADRRIPLTARVAEIETVKNESLPVYDVTITPYNCASNLQMFRAYLAPVFSGTTGTGSSSVTYGNPSAGDWPADARITVERSSKASVPVTGTWDLTSPKATVSYAADVEASVLQHSLMLKHEYKDIKVTRSGTCYGYKYDLEFTQTTGGNISSVSADGSSLTGNTPQLEVIKNDAHIFYDPIPGDMFVTAEDAPQVRVAINNINSRCYGDCSYSWSSADVPTVASCSPTSGSFGTSITITGTKFSATADENKVTVGEASCVVSSSTATQIVCDLQEGTIGSHTVDVIVNSLGKANSSVSFDYNSGSIDTVSPNKGSTAGGTYVTISGNGFAAGATANIDGNDCPVISLTPSEIVCDSPAGTGSVAVQVVTTSTLDCAGCFAYSAADTVTVTTFSPSTPKAAGGEVLTLGGTFTGIADMMDTIDLYLMDSSDVKTSLAINWTSTDESSIYASLPALAADSYTIKLRFSSVIGLASFSSTPTLTVTLNMNIISVNKGSFEGGTRLVVGGAGFGTDKDLVEVMVGESECDITELSDTEITCYTGRGSKTHTVTNGGIDPVFGLGYAWSPAVLQIMAGDRVEFVWTSPPYVTSNNFKVMQAPNAEDAPDGTGFDSGEGSPSGKFTHQFDTAGTYYYTSGIIGTNENVELRGLIEVSTKAAFSTMVSVTVNGVNAEASSGGSVDESGLPCEGTTAQITGMSEADPSSGGDFEFSYMESYTPTVTDLDVSSGYIDQDLTIDGTGFSTTACDNEVMFGEYTCVLSAQTATQITCAPDVNEEPDVGISFPVTVRVNNRGNALYSISPSFAVLPSMDSVSPATGSTQGGTMLTIAGAGFVGETEVMIGLVNCDIVNQTYTEIICETGPSSDASNDVTVTVTNSLDSQLPVVCPTSDCTFAHDTASTPTIVSVDSPSDLKIRDASTNISVTGTGFGTDMSALTVMIGDGEYKCDVTRITDTSFDCDLGPLPKGNHDFTIHVAGKGNGVGPTLSSVFSVESITPSSGSTHGGQLVTISGAGFRLDDSYVTINGESCEITDISIIEITCRTGANAAGEDLEVVVGVGSSTKNDLAYNYSSAATPEVTSISPVSGTEGESVTISGTGFSSSDVDNKVMLGMVECTVTSSSSTSLSCTLGGSTPGPVSVMVEVSALGYSNSDITFTYELSPDSLSIAQGSFGGGQSVTISGSGFVDGAMVKLCDKMADVTSVAPTSLVFVTPGYYSVQENDLACDVNVTIGEESVVMATKFTYVVASTPVISGVEPTRGGSQGGTSITITGSNFGSGGQNNVTVAGAVCDITSETTTEIICTTNAPASSSSGVSLSQKTNVVIEVGTVGHSTMENSDYWYVDAWSSTATWGGEPLPTEGDFIVIPDGQLLLLDTDTPILKMLLIQGGELLFDEKNLTLRAENILIVGGGRLTVGTEEAPFQHEAIIEMHGYLRSPELPIYGAKCLAIRDGELNLHGKPLRMTWTRLSETAVAGASQIKLEWGQADWPVGGTIAIATTGDRHSQIETELRTITAISADGKTISLDQPLDYDHLGVTEQLGGGHTLEMRAEVALLSRNVKVIGSRDVQWADDIEACPDGFDTGEFATQTCFQGRFGDEIGSDQFGAQIMFHAPVKDKKLAVGHLSYFEVNYAGQAFKLGRYPIHFHLNGDMSGSYVRGAAIHETFNRAINVHGTHNMVVEHTVIYNVMGGAFFLEDGIETGNIYKYNLALFVKASTSLLNDDITPAAFWATNPDNHYEHNAVAGGTHFGFWYRLLEHPEGPSATDTVCPRRVPLGTSYNNSVHSNGWFGLWTFQDYYPMVGGDCGSSEPEPAVFERFIVWNCEKGLEFVNGGALQFVDCLLANNKLTALEGKKNMLLGEEVPYSDRAPMLKDSVVAAYAPNYPHDRANLRVGVVLPWSAGFVVKNTTFINFDKPEEVVFGMTSIQGTCSELCGGWNYHFDKLSFINGQSHLANFRWLHDGVFVDIDGSLTGTVGGKALPWMDTLDPSKCTKTDSFSIGVEGAVCDSSTQFSRMSFNGANLASMAFKDVIFTNEFGTHRAFYADKRMTHKKGWTTVLQHGQTYKMVWENVEHITNISYSAIFEDLAGGGIVITHNVSTKPDRINIIGVERDVETEVSTNKLSYDNNNNGDFYFSDNEKELSYIVSDKMESRRKRAVGDSFISQNVGLSAYKCFWPNCDPPPDQNTLPPIAARPDHAVMWSNTTIWPNFVLPTEDSDVTISAGMWVVADVVFPRLNKLILEGNLELDHMKDPATNDYRDFTLEVNFIVVYGGRLVVGWPDDRFLGNVEIILGGTQDSESYPQTAGTTIGQKAIAVYGGLDLHGKQRSPVQTTLAQTAQAGSNTITVNHDIDWQVDEEIMVTSTSYDALETEVLTITAVNGRMVTFSPALQHRHLGESFTQYYVDITHSLAAEVALLSRNIVVRGGDHANLDRLGFGGRILVSSAVKEDNTALVGWARVSYTQFKHMGQLGYVEAFDPRYAIAYVQTGEVSSVKPSYLKSNSFHSGLSPAMGLFGASGILVQDNIAYRVVGGGMVVYGDNHLIERNLIALNLWPGSYQGRRETKNVAYEANFEMVKAGDIVFKDNIAAGSERAGFRVAGEHCGVEYKYSGNRAHAGMFGVMMWEGDEISTECFQVSGYTVWKNYDFGIFIQSPVDSIELHWNSLIENGVGLWTHTYSPGSLSHIVKLKKVTIQDGLVSGATEWFDCSTDIKPDTVSYELSSLARSWRIDGKGMVGYSFPNADGGSNGLPTHPFKGRMSYPAIDAIMYIISPSVVNYKARECDGATAMDYVISTNPSADDLNHPVQVSKMIVEPGNEKDNLIYFHSSNVRKVNPSDCVDMVCDGHRKAIVEDLDGHFLGSGVAGFVVDDATDQWDGDARYGIGDYRIPKVMLTAPNGTRLNPPPNKGIYLGNQCTKRESWQAFECYGDSYRMLVIESMDADTEVRRLSPIALRSRGGDYVDLINGPQDHGWCAGYTCQKRISTFWAVVAIGQTYDLYMTGSNPQHTRFYMLQAEPSEKINLAVYYHSPMRLDVFADDLYMYPKNAEIESDGDYKLLESTQSPSEYMPVLTDSHGYNYFDREWQLQYFIMAGLHKIDVIIKEVVVVSLSLPPMTVDDFFGEDIVNNLAIFLGVPSEKIRIVNVVRETGNRRKRQTGGVTLDIEIGDAPSSGQNVTNVNSGDLNRNTLLNLTRKVVDAVQLGTLGDALNITDFTINVQEPLPTPENSTSSAWATVSNGTVAVSIQIPNEMMYSVKLVGDREQQPFPTQPEFKMYDSTGELVEVLGSRADPWKIRALLSGGHPNAQLIGETVCGFEDGVCAFENLGISHSGSGYTIQFEIFDPAEASFSHVSDEITLRESELSAGFSYSPDKNMPVMIDEVFSVVVDLRDFSSQLRVEDIGWSGNTWIATLSLYSPELSPVGAMLKGGLEMTMDPTTGMANFTNVSISMGGRYFLQATIVSSTGANTIPGKSAAIEVKHNVTMQDGDISYNFTLRSPSDYNTYAVGMEDVIEASVYNYLQSIDPTARYHDFEIYEGSIYIHFWATGEADPLLTIISSLESSVTAGLSVVLPDIQLNFDAYMLVDDSVYGSLDGVTTTTTTMQPSTTEDLVFNTVPPVAAQPNRKVGLIVGCVVAALVAIAVAAVVSVMIIKKKSESKRMGSRVYPSFTSKTDPRDDNYAPGSACQTPDPESPPKVDSKPNEPSQVA